MQSQMTDCAPDAQFAAIVHRELKNQDTKLLPLTSPNINRFSNFFTDRLICKFATKPYLNIPPHLKYVATLPCENNCQKTAGNLKYALGLMINHKIVQPSIQVVMGYFITNLSLNLLLKQFFGNRWRSAEVTGKIVDRVIRLIRLGLLSSKMQNSPGK